MKCSKCKHYMWVADSPENVTHLCLLRGRKMENADGICELHEDPTALSDDFKKGLDRGYEIAREQADNEENELRKTMQSALEEIEASLAVIRDCMAKLGDES